MFNYLIFYKRKCRKFIKFTDKNVSKIDLMQYNALISI